MPGSLPDRLGAALEAIVISDRWVTCYRGAIAGAEGGWQRGLLHVARACIQGDALGPQRWQTHFQTLPDTAAVLINALPYLWLQADAHGHHSATVAGWAADLGRWRSLPGGEPATMAACEALFRFVCQAMKMTGAGLDWGHFAATPLASDPDGKDVLLGPVLQLVAQSQGEFAVVLGAACQRGWAATEVALAGLVVGLMQGRAGVGASLRQRWLLEYSGAGQDAWQGLTGSDLAAIATGLHDRWAGGHSSDRLERPSFSWGIRV